MPLAILLASSSFASTYPSTAKAQTMHAGRHPATLCVFDRKRLQSPKEACRPHAKAYPKYASRGVRKAIYDSALTFKVAYSTLMYVAACESGLNPRAMGYGYYGLFQFAPTTFQRAAMDMQHATGVRAKTPWDPQDSAYVAGYMFAHGRGREWGCF